MANKKGLSKKRLALRESIGSVAVTHPTLNQTQIAKLVHVQHPHYKFKTVYNEVSIVMKQFVSGEFIRRQAMRLLHKSAQNTARADVAGYAPLDSYTSIANAMMKVVEPEEKTETKSFDLIAHINAFYTEPQEGDSGEDQKEDQADNPTD